MIIDALNKLYDDLCKEGKVPPLGWESCEVSTILNLDEQGKLKEVIPLLTKEGTKEKPWKQLVVPLQEKTTSGIKASFLCGNAAYVLGMKTPKEVKLEHFDAFKKFNLCLLKGLNSPLAKAVCLFLNEWSPLKANNIEWYKNNENQLSQKKITFQCNNVLPSDDEEIKEVWQKYYETKLNEGEKRFCAVSGKQDVIADLHPKIKNIKGAQAEALLVSFNSESFNSYGKESGKNASISKIVAEKYGAALNFLTSNKNYKWQLGNSIITVVFWVDGGGEQYQNLFFNLIDNNDSDITQKDLLQILKAISNGDPVSYKDSEVDTKKQFYILGIGPNSGRLDVRLFLSTSFGSVLKNIQKHYERLKIIQPEYGQGKFIPLRKLLRATINTKVKEAKPGPQMATDTLNAIVSDTFYPLTLIENTMLRIKMEKEITSERAAIIKAYYLKNQNIGCPKEVLTMELNEESNYFPYVLGRIFAVLEMIQKAAIPTVNAGIRDKYFNSASSSPSSVFPLLINLAQKHLAKLSDGSRIFYDKILGSLMRKIDEEYPSRMSLAEQGAFQLGYYHEKQNLYEKKENREDE